MSGPIHERDEQCTVDPTTELCTVCGVDHSHTCPDCNGKGFHTATCFLWNPPERFKPEPFEEQRHIEFPTWLQALGFEDRSYRNDLAARAGCALTPDIDLICWVSAEKPEERETPEQTRYWVHTAPVDETEPLDTIYEGEDHATAYRSIVAWRALEEAEQVLNRATGGLKYKGKEIKL